MDASTDTCGVTGPEAVGLAAAVLDEATTAEPEGADCVAGTDPNPDAGRGAYEHAVRLIREGEAEIRAGLAKQLRGIAEASRQGLWAEDGARSLKSWLRELLNLAAGDATSRVRIAEAIQPRTTITGAPLPPTFSATAEAVHAGAVSLEHARVVIDSVEKLPPTATDAEWDTAERTLVEQARTLPPRQVRTVGERIRYLLDQDGVLREEERQYAARELHLGTGRDGMTLIRGRLDRVAGAQVSAVLESLAAPQPAVDGEKDPRTAGQRNADALTQVVEIAQDTDQLPRAGGTRPRVAVTIDYQRLRTELDQHRGAATNRLDTHESTGYLPGLGVLDNTQQPITPATVRRLACDAEILPIMLGGESQPLDVGRQKRTAPPHLRAALLARDGSCSFPGCDQPPGTSAAHHLVHWADGGRTSVDNMVMLCGTHHRTVHAHGWEITLRQGRPMFTPRLGSTRTNNHDPAGDHPASHHQRIPPPTPHPTRRRRHDEPLAKARSRVGEYLLIGGSGLAWVSSRSG